MSSRRLSARDYKHPRRGAFRVDAARLRDFAIGLAVGLTVAAIVFIADHRAHGESASEPARPVPARSPDDVGLAPSARASSATARAATAMSAATPSSEAASVGKYDFYQMLPRFEVVIPEHEHGSRPPATAQIVRPGTYFLQVGTYRDATLAERVRAQITRLGIDAMVQRIAVDSDVWHRVRVGPIRDLAQLNRLRHQLQASNLDSLVIRVED